MSCEKCNHPYSLCQCPVPMADLLAARAESAEAKRDTETVTRLHEEMRQTWLAEQRAHAETRRAWCVQLLTKRAGWSLNTWLETVDTCPEPVRKLVGENAGNPVGACDQCGQRAPLEPQALTMANAAADEQWNVCAWGCTPKEPSDG